MSTQADGGSTHDTQLGVRCGAAPFVKMPVCILEDAGLSAWARLTYALLLKYESMPNGAMPRQDRIASDLGVSRNTVKRALGELVAAGMVTRKRRGLCMSNIYGVAPERQQNSPDGSPVGHLDVSPVGHLDVSPVGHLDVSPVGHLDGSPVGHLDGSPVGHLDGSSVGHLDGSPVGHLDGSSVGHLDGSPVSHVNDSDGPRVSHVNDSDGSPVGHPDGSPVGHQLIRVIGVDGVTTYPALFSAKISPEENDAPLAPAENDDDSPALPTPDDFLAFWKQYPPRNGRRDKRAEAVSLWRKMNKADRAAALAAVGDYARSETARRGYAQDAVRWLKGRRWEDEGQSAVAPRVKRTGFLPKEEWAVQ